MAGGVGWRWGAGPPCLLQAAARPAVPPCIRAWPATGRARLLLGPFGHSPMHMHSANALQNPGPLKTPAGRGDGQAAAAAALVPQQPGVADGLLTHPAAQGAAGATPQQQHRLYCPAPMATIATSHSATSSTHVPLPQTCTHTHARTPQLPWLSSIHEFMKRATDAGSISRQEAVSMVPPLFMDVQPGHRVRGRKSCVVAEGRGCCCRLRRPRASPWLQSSDAAAALRLPRILSCSHATSRRSRFALIPCLLLHSACLFVLPPGP